MGDEWCKKTNIMKCEESVGVTEIRIFVNDDGLITFSAVAVAQGKGGQVFSERPSQRGI